MLSLPRYEYTPILGWSSSRYDTFSTCRRQYYYQYYGKHDREYPRQRIDALKGLVSVPLTVGTVVHDVVAAILQRLLKSASDFDMSRFGDFVRQRVERTCQTERFFEVHYAHAEAVRPEDLLPASDACLRAFLDSDRFAWVRDEALSPGNEWLVEPPGYGETRLDGMKAYCKVDFLFVVGGRTVILDWKTGKHDDDKHGRQLLAYSAWAASQLEARPEDIEAVVAYLQPAYDEVTLRPTADQLAALIERVRAQLEEMRGLCADVEQNVPRDKDAFPMVEGRPAVCGHCNFKELCRRA